MWPTMSHRAPPPAPLTVPPRRMPGRSISAPISAPLSTSTSVSAQLSPQLLTPLVALHPYWTRLCDGLNELDGVPREMEARTAELETVRGALVSQREKLAAVEAESSKLASSVRTVKSKRNIFLGGFTQSRASLVSNFDSPDTADAYGGAGSSDGASDQDPRTAAGTYRSHIAALEERVRELQEIKDELAPRAARHVALRGKLEALYDILFDDPSDVAEEMGARREVIGSQAVYDKCNADLVAKRRAHQLYTSGHALLLRTLDIKDNVEKRMVPMSPQDLERAQAALRDSARRFKEAEELSQDAKGIVVEGATVTISGFVGSLVRSDLRREWVRLARLEPTVRKTSLPRLERDVASLQVKHREAALKLAADRARLEAVRHAIMEEVAAAATIAIREEEEITPEEEDDPELELAPPAYSA